jgi:very-short-patch-repair endonuclease
VLEARLKALCRRHSLPAPHAQQQLGPYTVDFLWPEVRLVVEVDDYATHGRRATFESDRERDVWLQLRGYRVLRFTWRMLTEHPREVAATLRMALKG